MTAELESAILKGAYWLRRPGPNAQTAIAFTGAVAPGAIDATGFIGEDRRDVGLLSVTSPDRLYADWTRAQKAREQGLAPPSSHIEEIMAAFLPIAGLSPSSTVIRRHWAGWGLCAGTGLDRSALQNFGQSAAIGDLYRHYGIDARGIAEAVQAIAPGRPLRHFVGDLKEREIGIGDTILPSSRNGACAVSGIIQSASVLNRPRICATRIPGRRPGQPRVRLALMVSSSNHKVVVVRRPHTVRHNRIEKEP